MAKGAASTTRRRPQTENKLDKAPEAAGSGKGEAQDDELTPGEMQLIRDEIDDRLKKEIEILKQTITLSAKIFATSAVVFVAIFALLGWRTWVDIEKNVQGFVQQQAENLLVSEGSGANVKDVLDDLVNRTIVANAKVLSASRSDFEGPEISLEKVDRERLYRWINSPNLSLADFSDAISVLNLQSEEQKSEAANQLLLDLVNPLESNWINKQPQKILQILDGFKAVEMGRGVIELVDTAKYDMYIRLRAAEYIGEVGYADGAERLLEIYRKPESEELKRQIMVSLTVVKQDSPEVVAEIKALIEKQPNDNTKSAVAAIAVAMGSERTRQIELSTEFQSISNEVIRYLAANDIPIRCRAQTPRQGIQDCFRIYINPRTFGTSAKNALSTAEFGQLTAYWLTLSSLAKSNDLVMLRNLLPQPYFPVSPQLNERFGLAFSADGGTVSVSIDGNEQQNLSLDQIAKPILYRAGNDVMLSWIEGKAVKSANVTALKGENFQFRIPSEEDV